VNFHPRARSLRVARRVERARRRRVVSVAPWGGGAPDNPLAWLPPREFPLLAQAAEAGALSDGLADVLTFAVDGMIAALEAKGLRS